MAEDPNEGKTKRRKPGMKPDFATLAGLAVAMGGILYGFFLEHGKTGYLIGESAALIVVGGCLGATLVGNPMAAVLGAARALKSVFFEKSQPPAELIDEIIQYAVQARKKGIVSLEDDVNKIDDPFLRKAMMLAVDGADLQEIRVMLELEIEVQQRESSLAAKVFESAGGYAPTIGIIGAVLGLILTMRRLSEGPDKIGEGIATAFIATIYGVGLANLFLLPAANKIKARAHKEAERQELILEGVLSIVEGLNPKLIRTKLEAYDREPKKASKKPGGAAAVEAVAQE